MRVPNYREDSRQRGDFSGYALGIAASHNDFATGILPPDPPDHGAGVLFRRSSNRAGVQNHVAGGVPVGRSIQPQSPKLLLDGGPIGLGCAAAEIFYVKAGHRTILAYVVYRSLMPERLRRLPCTRYQ